MSHALILCYHAASVRWPHILSLSPERIDSQMRQLLASRHRPVDAREALTRRSRTFHVTFDDAFASIEHVLPRLQRLGVPVTVFVCSDYADTGHPLDVPELVGEAERYPEELRTLTWDELAGLAERGVEIGAHTKSHPHLRELGDAEVRVELSESRERIEERLGRPCRLVAYPYGEGDSRIFAAAREAGYEGGFMLSDGDPANRFAFPRIGVYPRDNPARFMLKANGVVRSLIARRAAPSS